MVYEGKSRNEVAEEEVVVNKCISDKTLKTIMKRFLGSKASDPEISKWYCVEDGLHFMATSLGCSVDLMFKRNFAGTYNPIKKHEIKYVNLKDEVSDAIYEYVEFKDGKKKVMKKTGHTLEFPDVKGLFGKYKSENFHKITLESEDIQELIDLHETMVSLSKLGNYHYTAALRLINNKLQFTVHDCKAKFFFEKDVNTKGEAKVFIYDPNYMVAIMKTLKDLKVEKVIMFLNDENPLLFYSRTTEYDFRFAFNRKLVGKASD